MGTEEAQWLLLRASLALYSCSPSCLFYTCDCLSGVGGIVCRGGTHVKKCSKCDPPYVAYEREECECVVGVRQTDRVEREREALGGG